MSEQSKTYRFLFRPRWIVLHVIMLVAMPLFAVAGFWQLSRLDERRTRNEIVETRRELPAVRSLQGDDLKFRRARISGHYDEDGNVILNGRPSNGRPGDHLLSPLKLADGSVVIVDRGWMPADVDPDDVSAPSDEVEVEGILFPSEGRAPFTPATSDRGPRITRIDLERLDDRLVADIAPVYLLLERQDAPQEAGLPEPVRPAALSEGSHLAYAVQWFLFIPTAIVVYVLVLRKQVRRRITYDAGP